MLYSYGDSGHLFADMYECIDRVARVRVRRDRVIHVEHYFLSGRGSHGNLGGVGGAELRGGYVAGY